MRVFNIQTWPHYGVLRKYYAREVSDLFPQGSEGTRALWGEFHRQAPTLNHLQADPSKGIWIAKYNEDFLIMSDQDYLRVNGVYPRSDAPDLLIASRLTVDTSDLSITQTSKNPVVHVGVTGTDIRVPVELSWGIGRSNVPGVSHTYIGLDPKNPTRAMIHARMSVGETTVENPDAVEQFSGIKGGALKAFTNMDTLYLDWVSHYIEYPSTPSTLENKLKGLVKVIKAQSTIFDALTPAQRATFNALASPTMTSFIFSEGDGGRVKFKRNDALAIAATSPELGKALDQVRDLILSGNESYNGKAAQIWFTLPGVKNWALFRSLNIEAGKMDARTLELFALGIQPDSLLGNAVARGAINTSIFSQPNKTPVNREFPLWERALARPGWAEVLYEIATDAGRRSTYEKNITDYMMFLFKIERYLTRHTGKPWKAMPKYVESTSQEMAESGPNGTVKTRSAFTPVADNETNVVTVPYVAVVSYGNRTSWCYAQYYRLLEEGFVDPISDSVIYQDLELKLNGRDDYGLMYYTLTGTDVTRGYPTFLIIFERLISRETTRVHFHRVHPKRRSENGLVPSHMLTRVCYQYMAGNVPACEVHAQQGDLVFTRLEHDPIRVKSKVGDPIPNPEFESHRMIGEGAIFYPNGNSDRNTLGYLHLPNGGQVTHPEHENIENISPGWFRVIRCRSWEANPSSVRSYNID